MKKTLQTLLTICSVFGICLQVPKHCGQYGLHVFRIYIALLMGISLFNCISGITRSKIKNGFIISWTVATLVFISQVATHFIIMYEALTKYQEHNDFIHILQDIDVYFKILLRMNVKKGKIIADMCGNLITIIVISKICLIVFVLIIIIYANVTYFWWALLAILAIRLRLMQVIIYAEILKHYVAALNRKLNQVVCLKTEESKQLLDIDYKQLQSIEVIRNIKHIYASIYEAANLMNEFAQASLFAASATNVLDCISHTYWTLLALDNLLPAYNLVSSMATIVSICMLIFKFFYTCQVLKDESQRTSLLLSRLITVGTSPAVAENYKNVVYDFAMQLMHQRIVFTGNHFFTFDLKCIFAIGALIVTQLIILIQFSKSDSTTDLNKTYSETV